MTTSAACKDGERTHVQAEDGNLVVMNRTGSLVVQDSKGREVITRQMMRWVKVEDVGGPRGMEPAE